MTICVVCGQYHGEEGAIHKRVRPYRSPTANAWSRLMKILLYKLAYRLMPQSLYLKWCDYRWRKFRDKETYHEVCFAHSKCSEQFQDIFDEVKKLDCAREELERKVQAAA